MKDEQKDQLPPTRPSTESANADDSAFSLQPSAFVRAPEWGLVVGILAVLLVIYFFDREHAFFQRYSLQTLVHRVALFGVLAVGAALVIIAGGIDLSTGAVVAISSIISAKLLTEWLRPAGSTVTPPSVGLVATVIGLTLLMGLAIGLFHALMINHLRLPPFIATLATMAGLRSLATVVSKNRTITIPSESYRLLGSGFRVSLSIFAVVAVTLSIMMGCTVLGRHIFALGGNEAAARLSGLRTRRLKAIVYGLSGMLSALGGILFTGLSGQADSRLGADVRVDGDHRCRGRRVQPLGRHRLDPRDGARIVVDPDRDQGDRDRRPMGRQHADRGPGAGHGRAGGRRVQPAIPGTAGIGPTVFLP